jgi:pyrroline-5-carboxylate reductase
MKNMKIGFIGAGHMGGAMIEGLIKSEYIPAESVVVKGGRSKTTSNLQKKLHFTLINDYKSFSDCDIVVIATGSNIVLKVLDEFKFEITSNPIIVSVAAGCSMDEMKTLLGESFSIGHAIPNTPVSVNAGMTGISFSENSTEEDKYKVMSMFKALGGIVEVEERLLGTFGTVAGCSPAFVDVFMEALADASVMNGLPRDLSYEVVAQMMLGSAKLALDSKKHPGELKDGVCSPGGTTIKGVAALEKNGFRYAVIDAVNTANN